MCTRCARGATASAWHVVGRAALDDVGSLILNSSVDDWHFLPTGPFFEHRLGEVISHQDGNEEHWFRHSTHTYHATYKPDVSLRLAFGLAMSDSREWRPDWARFADDVVDAHYADTFWNGSLVDRNVVIEVDGGCAIMPDPPGVLRGDRGGRVRGRGQHGLGSERRARAAALPPAQTRPIRRIFGRTGFVVVD